MERTITLQIAGSGQEDGDDAPGFKEFLAQITDYLAIFEGVEEAIAAGKGRELEWRITGASRNSPVTLKATAYPKTHGMDVNGRYALVQTAVREGLSKLGNTGERPPYFTDGILKRTEEIFRRITQGLPLNNLDFGGNVESITLTPTVAAKSLKNTERLLNPQNGDKPYKELGTIEGFILNVKIDRRGDKPYILLAERRTGKQFRCDLSDHAARQLGDRSVEDVLFRQPRVEVRGTLHYRSLGLIHKADIDEVRFLRDRKDLPDITVLLDRDFTKGMRTEYYLEKLRNGDLS